MSSMMFKTDEAQRRNHIPVSEREHFERVNRPAYILRRKTVKAVTPYHSPLLAPKEEAAEMKKQLLYSLIGVSEFGEFRDRAAAAVTNLALTYGLNPFNGEVYAIPKKGKGGAIKGFTPYVGYKGHFRAARDVARKDLNTDFLFGAPKVLPPDEVRDRGADRCTRCGGSGKFANGGNCNKCQGEGRLDADEVAVIKIPVSLFSKVQMAKAVGVEFEPTWGVGVWQPGDNIPDGRDPQWVATKRAKVDALRAEFDLPFSYGEGPQADYETPEITIINPNETDQHPVIDAAQIAGITYDDEALFIQVVEDAIAYLGFESPGHVMEAFNAMEHTSLSVDDLDVTGSVLENWLTQQEEAATPEQAELPIEEAA